MGAGWSPHNGIVSHGASFPSNGWGYLSFPHGILQSRSTASFSFWIQLPENQLANLPTGRMELLGIGQGVLDSPLPIPDLHAYLTSDGKLKMESDWVNFGSTSQLSSWSLPADFDDGKWHHLVIIKNGASYLGYVDGALIGLTNSNNFTFRLQHKPYFILGRRSTTGFTSAGLQGKIDRFRVYSRRLSSAEATALYEQDIDRDGLYDRNEGITRLWRDLDSDGFRDYRNFTVDGNGNLIPSNDEVSHIASPYLWDAADADHDDDGAFSIDEQNVHLTDFADPDTDDDLLPDGWEIDNGLNALVSNASDTNGNGRFEDHEYTNSDTDALTDIEEYRYNTNPNQSNSDGGIPGYPDNSDDATEVAQGSNPNDPTDGGQAPAPEQMQPILLGIGDESGSESEDYVLHCYQLDPASGAETRVFTLRSGGYGEYKEETLSNVFRKGLTYTFQIHWQGSKLTSQSGGSGQQADGPDFDYTFKVELQGNDPTAMLIDQWRPGESRVLLSSPLLAVDASDVAATPSEFREQIQNGRVLYLPVRLASIDRMVGGAIDILPGLGELELTFSNETTGEQIGSYGYLDGSGDTQVYDEIGGMIGLEDGFGSAVTDPSVWFLRDEWSPYRTQFYLISGAPGDPQHGTIKVEARFQGTLLGAVRHAMLPVPVFGSLIASATDIVSGSGFNFGSGAAPVPLTDAEKWAAAMLIPVYPIAYGIEGVGILVHGILDGIVNGFEDDWEFAELIVQGLADTSDYAAQAIIDHIQSFMNDPMARIKEVKDAVEAFISDRMFDQDVINHPGHLGNLPDYLHEFWERIPRGDNEGFHDQWDSMVDSVLAWFSEVSAEHAAQAEATAWVNTPFDRTRLVANGTELFRTFCYSTGHTFGYLCEQVALGAVTGGILPVAKVVAKSGAKAAADVALRTAASVSIRLHWWKKILAESSLADASLRAAYERAMVLCIVEPVGPTIKECAKELMEKMFRRPTVSRTAYNYKELLDDIVSKPNLRKLTLTPGKEAELFNRIA